MPAASLLRRQVLGTGTGVPSAELSEFNTSSIELSHTLAYPTSVVSIRTVSVVDTPNSTYISVSPYVTEEAKVR